MIVESYDAPENRRDCDGRNPAPASVSAITLAHVSDPHIANMKDIKPSELLNKRLLGYLKWILHRGARHSDEILWALADDLKETRPDHVAERGTAVDVWFDDGQCRRTGQREQHLQHRGVETR